MIPTGKLSLERPEPWQHRLGNRAADKEGDGRAYYLHGRPQTRRSGRNGYKQWTNRAIRSGRLAAAFGVLLACLSFFSGHRCSFGLRLLRRRQVATATVTSSDHGSLFWRFEK
ncbi:uncharacterized protein G2W53_023798 [Senna tora]|uniref:Uncharacterized protein n=1 Tax=Senna tora TaxID=362788 RepID=A0A834WEU3_9FABA|nr:uncharacterized protein G2W53_023798 [Senna tora]